LAYRREPAAALESDPKQREPLRMQGLVNWLFLAGILAAVLLQSESVGQGLSARLGLADRGIDLTLRQPLGEVMMLTMAGLSLLLTPGRLRRENGFSWGPILEVAVLFAGIFVVMVPALQWLRLHGRDFGVTQPWQYFWLTGSLSAVLDNAPTYLTFAQLAASPHDLRWLVAHRPVLLQAVSAGAVFMGALSYIGNGPNFMVKAIAEEAGYRVPSFFGYLIYSNLILVPIFVLITLAFFTAG
jgi:Na+/H+ antiporter NhaD/arsenite permease-like protein